MNAVAAAERRFGPETGPATAVVPEYRVGEHFVSNAAHAALRAYSEATGDQRIYEHSLRVADVLHDFMGGELEGNVYDAAALHDLAQRAKSKGAERTAAVEALNEYSKGVEGEYIENDQDIRITKWEYVSTLLADMDKIERCSERGRKIVDVFDLSTPDPSLELDKTLHQDDSEVPIEVWTGQSGLVDPKETKKLLKKVNIEAALIKAAEMFDNLKRPAPTDRAVFDDVVDAESFYAPMCEAIGFDGLCMALRSEAARIRFRRAGIEDELSTETEGLLAGLQDDKQVLSYVWGLFRHLLGGEVEVRTPLRDASGHGIKLGSVVLYSLGIAETANLPAEKDDDPDDKPYAHYRVKSPGSIERKLFRSGRRPVDILGVTIVVKDLDELAVTFRGLVECIKANRVVKELPSGENQQAYSVQGKRKFRSKVMGALLEPGLVDEAEVEDEPKKAYQVAKATIVYRPHIANPSQPEAEIRTEIMLQTRKDWLAGWIGRGAHLLYKAETEGGHKQLRSINKRREHLGKPGLNPNSLKRGARFRENLVLSA